MLCIKYIGCLNVADCFTLESHWLQGALFFGDFFPEQGIYENVTNLYLFHENSPDVIYPMKFIDNLTNEKICQIESADISLNGHLVLVDSVSSVVCLLS